MTNILPFHLGGKNNKEDLSLQGQGGEVISLQGKVGGKVDSQIQDRNPVIEGAKLKSPLNRYIKQVLEYNDDVLDEIAREFAELGSLNKGLSYNKVVGEISSFLPFGDTPDSETPALLVINVCDIIREAALRGDFSEESWQSNLAYRQLLKSIENTSIFRVRLDIVLSYFQKYFLRAQLTADNQLNAQ